MPVSDRERFHADYVGRAAHILGILSHEARLAMLLHLAQGELTVSELRARVELPQSNVSHHLRILRDASLVRDRRDGQYVRYRLDLSTWKGLADGFFDKLLEGQDVVRLQNFLVARVPEDGEASEPDRGPSR